MGGDLVKKKHTKNNKLQKGFTVWWLHDDSEGCENNLQILDSINREEWREWYQEAQVEERDDVKMKTMEKAVKELFWCWAFLDLASRQSDGYLA